MTDVKLQESEMNALGEQALADFAARQGLALEPNQTTPAAPRSMGVASEPRVAEGEPEKT
jgi:hypothetical protein